MEISTKISHIQKSQKVRSDKGKLVLETTKVKFSTRLSNKLHSFFGKHPRLFGFARRVGLGKLYKLFVRR